jgi:branched-chain amino acid aminotransferase
MNCALAMQEGYRRGAFEVIMRNYRGELAECSVSNLFIVKNGAALTPPLSAGLLPGITREFVFEVGGAAGIPVREAVLKDADLFGADEVFLTGTTREIMPIVSVDDRDVASGLPGPVTKALHQMFRQMATSVVQAT